MQLGVTDAVGVYGVVVDGDFDFDDEVVMVVIVVVAVAVVVKVSLDMESIPLMNFLMTKMLYWHCKKR